MSCQNWKYSQNWKKHCISISGFGYENKENMQCMSQKILSIDMLIYYW